MMRVVSAGTCHCQDSCHDRTLACLLPAAGTLNTVLPVLEAMASGRRQGRLALMSSVSTTVPGAVEFAGGQRWDEAQ